MIEPIVAPWSIEPWNVFFVFFIIYFGLKMIRGLCCCKRRFDQWKEGECDGKEPFYVIIVATKDSSKTLASQIKSFSKTGGTSFALLIVNDTDCESEYTKRAIELVQSMLKNKHLHPILAFKTNPKYKTHFSGFFPDVCILEDFSSPEEMLVYRCPGVK